MDVFISWSKSRSKEIANSLRDWLPLVLQYIHPFVSDKDISAGERWAQAIAGKLQESNFGIICITPENISSEWILFESGALSKSMSDGKVIPLLFELELSDLSGPISQFQAQKADEAGITEIVRAINSVAETPAPEVIVNQLVPSLWPQLREKFSQISKNKTVDKHKRPQNDILEELVKDVRGLGSSLREIRTEQQIDKYPSIYRKITKLSPEIFNEIYSISRSPSGLSISILLLSSILREEAYPISEILLFMYREIISRRRYSTQMMEENISNIEDLIGNKSLIETGLISKYAYKFVLDIPMFLRHSVAYQLKARETNL